MAQHDPDGEASVPIVDMTRPLQQRAEALAGSVFMGSPVRDFEEGGRLQLATLVHEGLNPDSKLLDVGCGALRGGYWFMHFLEPGHYFGIEPNEERLAVALRHIIEPHVLERARPSFSGGGDFDFSVFGTKFDFVVARSIWTHASKTEIERMLDGFVAWGSPGAVFLASYVPASRLPNVLWEPVVRYLRARHVRTWLRLRKVLRVRAPDYRGAWNHDVISHRFAWVAGACRARGLAVRELDYGILNSQVWLRIDHPG